MGQVIALILQVFILWLKECFERKKEEREKQKELRDEAKAALKSRDIDTVVNMLTKLRNK